MVCHCHLHQASCNISDLSESSDILSPASQTDGRSVLRQPQKEQPPTQTAEGNTTSPHHTTTPLRTDYIYTKYAPPDTHTHTHYKHIFSVAPPAVTSDVVKLFFCNMIHSNALNMDVLPTSHHFKSSVNYYA